MKERERARGKGGGRREGGGALASAHMSELEKGCMEGGRDSSLRRAEPFLTAPPTANTRCSSLLPPLVDCLISPGIREPRRQVSLRHRDSSPPSSVKLAFSQSQPEPQTLSPELRGPCSPRLRLWRAQAVRGGGGGRGGGRGQRACAPAPLPHTLAPQPFLSPPSSPPHCNSRRATTHALTRDLSLGVECAPGEESLPDPSSLADSGARAGSPDGLSPRELEEKEAEAVKLARGCVWVAARDELRRFVQRGGAREVSGAVRDSEAREQRARARKAALCE
eukprot:782787-Rhodomonas_salina.1